MRGGSKIQIAFLVLVLLIILSFGVVRLYQGGFFVSQDNFSNEKYSIGVIYNGSLDQNVLLGTINGLNKLGYIQGENTFYILKDAFKIGNNSPKVKLKYHLLRGIYYKDKEKYSQAQKLFKIAVSGNEINNTQYQNILLDLLLEIGEFHIHYRKDNKKAFYNLELASKFLSKKTISGLKRSLRWTLLMGDFYKILINDSEKSSYYLGQSRIIRSQLNTIGVLD